MSDIPPHQISQPTPAAAAAAAAVPNAGGEDLTPVAVAPLSGGVGGGAGAPGAPGPEVPGSVAGASTGTSSGEGLLQKAQAMAQPVSPASLRAR